MCRDRTALPAMTWSDRRGALRRRPPRRGDADAPLARLRERRQRVSSSRSCRRDERAAASLLERLLDALTDPARRERAVVWLLDRLLRGVVALRRARQGQPGRPFRHGRDGRVVARRRHRHAEASAARRLAGRRVVQGLSARRLGLLPVRHGARDLRAVGRVARVRSAISTARSASPACCC